jgi:hypothetical protein
MATAVGTRSTAYSNQGTARGKIPFLSPLVPASWQPILLAASLSANWMSECLKLFIVGDLQGCAGMSPRPLRQDE